MTSVTALAQWWLAPRHRFRLRSSSCAGQVAHPGHARFGCGAGRSLFTAAPLRCFRCLGARPRDGWCGSRHTLSALSSSSLAKEPRCSQTCRKCVWSI